MAEILTMPKLGLTMTKGIVLHWLKKEGEYVNKGEPLVEIETDKINIEYESPKSGYLLKILLPEGSEGEVLTPICILGQQGENIDGLSATQSDAQVSTLGNVETNLEEPIRKKDESKRVLISPVAKKMAEENNIDYKNIVGTGPNGRITKEDIEKAILEKNKNAQVQMQEKITESKNEAITSVEFETISLSNMRKVIAERLSYSKKEIPHVYFKVQVDMSKAAQFRNEFNQILKEKGIKLSFTHVILKTVALAMQEFPDMNATIKDNSIVRFKDINIGLAVDLTDGLIVPVVKQADKMTLAQICKTVEDLVQKAYAGKLGIDEITGGTFTVSNLGMYGIDEFAAIINPPESGILAVGTIKDTPVAENGTIAVKPMMNLVLSVDHRIIDGALAAKFLNKIKQFLENPFNMLLFD